jgi:tetratricopeptide (TPR) repeat protein
MLVEEIGDIYPKTWVYNSYGISCYLKGFLGEATEHLLKGAEFSEKINIFFQDAQAHDWLGEIYFEVGEYQNSQKHCNKAIRLKETGRLPHSWINLSRIGSERAKVMNYQKHIDLESLYRYEAKNNIKLYEGWMRRSIGEILLNIDDHHLSEAEDWIRKAIEADLANSVIFQLAKDHALYADLLTRKGDKSKAKENLAQAIEIFKECGSDGWVKKYEEELASLS